jgi:hypothetical protein
MIDYWLLNDPVNRKGCRVAYNYYEQKIKPRIEKIREKGASPETNFQTRCNALGALVKVAEAIIVNSKLSNVGCNIQPLFFNDPCLEDAMLDVLEVMSHDEILQLFDFTFEGEVWREEVEAVLVLARTQDDRMFEGFEEILRSVDHPTKDQAGVERLERMIANMAAKMSKNAYRDSKMVEEIIAKAKAKTRLYEKGENQGLSKARSQNKTPEHGEQNRTFSIRTDYRCERKLAPRPTKLSSRP